MTFALLFGSVRKPALSVITIAVFAALLTGFETSVCGLFAVIGASSVVGGVNSTDSLFAVCTAEVSLVFREVSDYPAKKTTYENRAENYTDNHYVVGIFVSDFRYLRRRHGLTAERTKKRFTLIYFATIRAFLS